METLIMTAYGTLVADSRQALKNMEEVQKALESLLRVHQELVALSKELKHVR